MEVGSWVTGAGAIDAVLEPALAAGAGLSAERLTVIRDAVATDALVLSPDEAWFRREFALPDDAPVIGVVAQLIERKGHADLLDALPLVLGEHPDLRVLLFGRGPLEQTLRMKAQAHGLEAVVRFCGFRHDLRRILPCLDLLVHPARREGMGVAVLEAASAALPVVACRAGGVAEIVVSGETGLLVEPAEPLALADAIRALLDDPEQARAMGVRARRRIEELFSLQAQAAAHISLYESVL
ncbi:MAG: glycosyltransferase [Pseudomonadota bacterium]